MKAKDFLKQYEQAVKDTNKLERELSDLRESYDQIKSVTDYDGMPHGSNIGHPTEEKAIKVADKSLEYVRALQHRSEVREAVFEVVFAVKGIEGDVLYERYIKLKKWEDICVQLNYSWNGVHSAHKRALNVVSNMV